MKKSKEVIVYFPNWNLDEKSAERGGEVSGIPWKSVTYINHAFFRVEVADGTKESTFEWRAAGKEPRTKFVISTKEPKADFEDEKNNEYNVVTELTYKNGEDEFRPDVIMLINGMPLGFLEVKKPNNREGILAERNRINDRFKNNSFVFIENVNGKTIYSYGEIVDNTFKKIELPYSYYERDHIQLYDEKTIFLTKTNAKANYDFYVIEIK